LKLELLSSADSNPTCCRPSGAKGATVLALTDGIELITEITLPIYKPNHF
jgi:hypothetical protein